MTAAAKFVAFIVVIIYKVLRAKAEHMTSCDMKQFDSSWKDSGLYSSMHFTTGRAIAQASYPNWNCNHCSRTLNENHQALPNSMNRMFTQKHSSAKRNFDSLSGSVTNVWA